MIIETSGPGGGEQVFLDITRNIDISRFEPIVVLFKKGWLFDRLEESNIKVKVIESGRSWDLIFLYRMICFCRKHKISLIQSHFMGSNLYACLAGMILRIPVVATFHNELILSWWSYNFAGIKHFLIRYLSSKIVVVADFMKKDYLNIAKFPRGKLLTIYNGIDLIAENETIDIVALKKELGILEEDFIVGNIANFRSPKGHRYLIEAASIVCKSISSAKFLLIGDEGDGIIKKEIKALIAELGLEENIKLLGFRKDARKLLKIIDLFVLSSISEGLPLSVIEAMASSIAVVATDVGGLYEIVIPNKTGYLVETENAAALAEKLIILLENKTLRIQMGRAGQEVVQNKFSLKTMIENYQNLYEDLIK